MKTKTFGLAALTLGVAMLANAAMADPLTRTWNGRMQDDPANFSYKTVYGRDGNPVLFGRDLAQNEQRAAKPETVGTKQWNGKMQDDPSNFRRNGGVYGRSAVYDIGNPSVSQAQAKPDCCEKMMHKAQDKTYPR